MIANLKPYSKYKEAGPAWLGRVPEHWDVKPAFGAFIPNHERNRGMVEKRVLSLSYGRIIVKPPEKLHGLVPESFETYQVVNPGYIVVRTTDLQNDHTSLRIGFVRDRGIITSAYLALRVMEGVLPKYGFQLLNVWDMTKAIYGYGSGLRQNLDFSHFKRMPIALPSPDEQGTIVRFLEYACGRIERAIRAKKKLIALLNEQKQCIICRAVTLGLDASERLKPSGIPWVRQVPENWEVRPIKQLLTRMDYGTSENARGDGPVRVLTMGHIRDGRIILPEHGSLNSVPVGLLLEKHDLLFNRTNSPELVGKVGLFEGGARDQVTFASYLVRLRVSTQHCPEWLNYLLNSIQFWRYARSQALVSLHQANLNSARYGRMLVPVPATRDEETKIVSWIRSQTREIDLAVDRLTKEIGFLREYRTRLIADVVTGKLDVRETASHLSDKMPPEGNELSDIEATDDTEIAEDEGALA